MKVFITGGTGFLGRHVVERLCATGHQVVFTGRQRATGEAIAAATGAQFVALDLALDLSGALATVTLTEAMHNAEAVIHSAALAAPWGDWQKFYDANVVATQNVIRASLAARVRRLVNLSTPSVYFEYRDRLNIRESEPLPRVPVNHYAATKLRAEQAVAAVAQQIEVVSLRPRALFGPWDTAIMPRLIKVAASGTLPLLRGGAAQIDVTWIGNAVDAVELALLAPQLKSGSVYNISNGEPLTARELFARVTAALELKVSLRPVPYRLAATLAGGAEWWADHVTHREPRVTRYSLALLAYSQTLDISAARRELGYHPTVSVNEGLQRYAAWLRTAEGKSATN
ncbi:MAG: NAD-dependent epimerase/dehydratase family protein [Acidobacteria bacterium]|nr:NAD-dependent epimerase/dehydratase family protein [Acidobacteriota bacterium]